MRLAQKPEWKFGADPEAFLGVPAAAREGELDVLGHGSSAGNVRNINRLLEDLPRGRSKTPFPLSRTGVAGRDCDGKRGEKPLQVFERQPANHRSFREDVVGEDELEAESGEHDLRKNPRDQDARQEARQNNKQQVVSGIEGGDGDHRDDQQIDHAFAGELILDFDHPSLERCAPREVRDHFHRHDPREQERRRGGPCGQDSAARFSQRG